MRRGRGKREGKRCETSVPLDYGMAYPRGTARSSRGVRLWEFEKKLLAQHEGGDFHALVENGCAGEALHVVGLGSVGFAIAVGGQAVFGVEVGMADGGG